MINQLISLILVDLGWQRLLVATGSFMLHGLVATFLLRGGSSSSDAFVPPLAPLEVIDLSAERTGELLDPQNTGPVCETGKAYIGIGIQLNSYETVVVAPESYPAYQAGIRVGDLVLNPDVEPDFSGYETVDVQRQHRHHRVHIKTQWICLR